MLQDIPLWFRWFLNYVLHKSHEHERRGHCHPIIAVIVSVTQRLSMHVHQMARLAIE